MEPLQCRLPAGRTGQTQGAVATACWRKVLRREHFPQSADRAACCPCGSALNLRRGLTRGPAVALATTLYASARRQAKALPKLRI